MTAVGVDPLAVPRFPEGSPRPDNGQQAPSRWPVLSSAALHGLAGEVVKTIAPETEADPAALLISFQSAFGSAVGPMPRARADGADHPARLFAVVVGRTSKARKGTSWQRISELMRASDPEWSKSHVKSGLSSGEGLIQAAAREADKRLFVHEGEFAKTLKVASREGNVLSEVLRLAWDSGDLQVMTREPLQVSGAHISIVAHITEEELHATLTGLQAANGFANRFLLVCARRSKLLPSGGTLDDQAIAELGAKVKEALERGRDLNILKRSSDANDLWSELYRELAEDTPGGLLGGLISRSEAQLLRLSVTYAVLDGSRRIEPQHLEAAWALWSYCRDSAAYLFGSRLGDPEAEKLLDAFELAPAKRMSLTDCSKALGTHVYGDKLDRILTRLVEAGHIDRVVVATNGRPKTEYVKAVS